MNTLKEIVTNLNRWFLYYMLIYGTLLFIFSMIGLISIYLQERFRKYKKKVEHHVYFPISIVVPVFDDDQNVIETIEHLAQLGYCHYEIVVIKTGHNDQVMKSFIEKYHLKNTNKIIKKRLETAPIEAYYEGKVKQVPLTLIIKREGDKADALNAGLNTIQYPYFMTLEVGSVVKKDSLNSMIAPVLADHQTIVVTGSIAPIKDFSESSSLTKGTIAYLLASSKDLFSARVLATMRGDHQILSTGFSLFRKEEVLASGGYDSASTLETFQLDLKVRHFCLAKKQPFSVHFVSDAICYQETPSTRAALNCFHKERYATLLATVCSSHYKKSFSDNVVLSAYVLCSMVFPLLELGGLLSLFVALFLHLDAAKTILFFYGLYLIFNAAFFLLCLFTSHYAKDHKFTFKERSKSIGGAFLQVIGYRQINSFYCLRALFKKQSI